jgi:hypothetical protein
MVQSIWLKLDKPRKQDVIYSILDAKYKLEPYNQQDGSSRDIHKRYSIEKGFTFVDKSIIESALRKIITDYDKSLDCKCEFCTMLKTRGNLVVYMFGITFSPSIDDLMANKPDALITTIGRNIWMANWMCFIQDDRLKLLNHFLEDIKQELAKSEIESTLDMNDCDLE